jgi:hypothetical protein
MSLYACQFCGGGLEASLLLLVTGGWAALGALRLWVYKSAHKRACKRNKQHPTDG